MSTGFTRTERRQLKRLEAENAAVVAADRRFFARHPNRMHRLRLTSRAEVKMLEMVAGPKPATSSRIALYTAVKNAKGFPLPWSEFQWAVLPGPADYDNDLPEALARDAFQFLMDKLGEAV